MDYQVTLTTQAMEQIRQTALYIAHTLHIIGLTKKPSAYMSLPSFTVGVTN